ncbi:hypothetical protein TRFO_23439 [Tritrichomonas foetus]|uniref:PQ loop repeat family protein n=1 Tax=Tritrichomonas foetus TaxID=1144522 RepID=A0A1J4KAA9_9EUKA|nr:hypothetical protein TRFO_23439 [Tritrichomonas foetus]|eukprot:OHT08155.1 hypothetical protein TRFO_23439 [Tritrichomonas foetus]
MKERKVLFLIFLEFLRQLFRNLLNLIFLMTKMSFGSVAMIFVDLIVMIAPTSGYLDTVRIMITNKSPAAFNYNTCLILLSAHGLKILYYIYHPYAIRIFGQSITQFSVAMVMAFLKYRYSRSGPDSIQRRQSTSSIHDEIVIHRPKNKFAYFLSITSTVTFGEFMTSFFLYALAILSLFYLSYFTINETATVDAIGLIANLIESTVSVPTFIKIVCYRDINNVSNVLILQFVFGDMMKLALFILSGTPWSFIAGALLQLTLDIILFVTYLQLLFCSGISSPNDQETLIRRSSFSAGIEQNNENNEMGALKGVQEPIEDESEEIREVNRRENL